MEHTNKGDDRMNRAEEYWKDIVGYEGLYQVSNFGRVKSLERKSHRLINGGVVTYPEKIKTLETVRSGYKRVNLYRDGKLKKYLVHRLVAFTFLGKPAHDEMQVNHKNGITSDNNVENLEWVTIRENANHKSTVLNKKPRGVYKAGKNGWSAQIVVNQRKTTIGTFKNKSCAYKAFYEKYLELRGTPAWDLNKYKTH